MLSPKWGDIVEKEEEEWNELEFRAQIQKEIMLICQDGRYKKANKPFSNDASATNDEGRSHNLEEEVHNIIQQQLNNNGETQLIEVEQQQNLAAGVQRNRKMMKNAEMENENKQIV